MNERIKELISASGFTINGDNDKRIIWLEAMDSTGMVLIDPNENLEKFAELIVKECATQIQQQVSLKYKDGDDGNPEEWVDGHYAGSLLSRVVIKQYFGVE